MKRTLAVLAVPMLVALGCAKPTATQPSTSPGTDTPPPHATPLHQASSDAAKHEQSPPTVVFLLRHAEKADDGTRDPPLLPEGSARADCLANALRDVAVTHVFATKLRRTSLTVEPLAKSKGLQVQTGAPADVEGLAASLHALPPGSTAVVAGHSNTIPTLAELMGAPLSHLGPKGHIPENENDRLIELVVSEGLATPHLVELRYCAPSPTP